MKNSDETKQNFVNPEVLPSFFSNVEILGPANLDVEMFRAMHNSTHDGSPITGEIGADTAPILMVDKKVKEIYQKNDFAKMKELEKKAQKDLQAVYDNIATHGDGAWARVRCNNEEFYMSWSETGSIWCYTQENKTLQENGSEVKTSAKVQIGTYSQTAQVAGIQVFTLNIGTIITNTVIAYVIARAVSSIVANGLGFAVTAFALYVANALAAIGVAGCNLLVPAALVSAVATGLVFIVVFIGLTYLWDWLNRKYTIRLQIFNWDDNNSWKAGGQYLSNAKVAGEEKDDEKKLDFVLPKMSKPGSTVLPPGFSPVEVLDSICYYAIVIWENDSTFMEGCSMAVKMIKGDTNEGFMWAFDCPRFSDNKQAAENGLKDPEKYLKDIKWNKTPLGFEIESTSAKIPISCSVDKLSGASDNLYNINININQKLKTT